LTSWLLGYPDRALDLAEGGVATARRLRHPFSRAQALCYKAILHQLRGEPEPVAAYADELLAVCVELDLKMWSYNGQMLKGWTLLRKGVLRKTLAGSDRRSPNDGP
jgi:predicted ATPase